MIHFSYFSQKIYHKLYTTISNGANLRTIFNSIIRLDNASIGSRRLKKKKREGKKEADYGFLDTPVSCYFNCL